MIPEQFQAPVSVAGGFAFIFGIIWLWSRPGLVAYSLLGASFALLAMAGGAETRRSLLFGLAVFATVALIDLALQLPDYLWSLLRSYSTTRTAEFITRHKLTGWVRLWLLFAVPLWGIGAWWALENMPPRFRPPTTAAQACAEHYPRAIVVEPQRRLTAEEREAVCRYDANPFCDIALSARVPPRPSGNFERCMAQARGPAALERDSSNLVAARWEHGLMVAGTIGAVVTLPLALAIAIAMAAAVGGWLGGVARSLLLWVRQGFDQDKSP